MRWKIFSVKKRISDKNNQLLWFEYANSLPCAPFHESANVKNRVKYQEKGIPQANTSIHCVKIQAKSFTNSIYHFKEEEREKKRKKKNSALIQAILCDYVSMCDIFLEKRVRKRPGEKKKFNSSLAGKITQVPPSFWVLYHVIK